MIRGNTCSNNGLGGDGAGIHAISFDNRIEGNNCTTADRGIDVDGGGNIIIRNTCASNTINWVIAAGNAYGPIVATPAGAAVNGNTAVAGAVAVERAGVAADHARRSTHDAVEGVASGGAVGDRGAGTGADAVAGVEGCRAG